MVGAAAGGLANSKIKIKVMKPVPVVKFKSEVMEVKASSKKSMSSSAMHLNLLRQIRLTDE